MKLNDKEKKVKEGRTTMLNYKDIRSKRYWLSGGIMGVIVGVIINVLFIFFLIKFDIGFLEEILKNNFDSIGNSLLVYLIKILFLPLILSFVFFIIFAFGLLSGGNDSIILLPIAIIILGTIYYFVLGAIIGFIYGLLRKIWRSKKERWSRYWIEED